jgi:hypothetical protein
MVGWIGALLLVIALVLWYAFTSPEFRPAGGRTAPSGTSVGELRPFRARTGNQQLDIAFAYCQVRTAFCGNSCCLSPLTCL